MCGFSEEAHEKGKEANDPERGAALDQYQLHLKVVGGVCYALVVHSGVNVPYLEERGYHFERREYRFNFRHVPDSMRDQLLKSFPQGGKKGCSFLERGELPQPGGELFLPANLL